MTDAYLGTSGALPGIDTSAAGWLVDHAARLTGTDTIAYEALAPGDPDRPVHRILLQEAGIYIVENLALEELAATGVAEFALVIAPLRLVGASGSPVRPLALVS
jgi:kynurenine formamidase